jgi:hypothetical protein
MIQTFLRLDFYHIFLISNLTLILTLSGNGVWSPVGDESLSLHLIKECAVSITYSLPLSQYGNPNFDSNVWSTLATVKARLLVDNIPYTFFRYDIFFC